MPTKIEWADEVWNPTTGCTKVSEGCRSCYAESIAKRFWGERKFTDVQCHPERLDIPSHWKKPRRIFVDSMSDLFHSDVPNDFILRVWMVMAELQRHTFMILTKRPKRMNLFITEWLPGAWGLATMSMKLLDTPLPNVWLGVSGEDQKTIDKRVPILLQTPTALRFVSIEPMLDIIHLQGYFGTLQRNYLDPDFKGDRSKRGPLDFVIAGCESGQKARPSPPYIDVRYLKDQCVEAGVPFFLKQMWGKKTPELDGRQWLEFPKEREK